MKVESVTPPDAASDSKHPDHDRWVKEHTLKMEVEHAKLLGLPLSVAEAENQRLLERAEQLARHTPASTKPTASSQEARSERMKMRGVTKRAPRKAKAPKGCVCGWCLVCKRNIRVLAIFQRKQSGDLEMRQLVTELGMASMAATTGVGAFKGLSKFDAKRLLASKIDAICDRSVRQMGPWR